LFTIDISIIVIIIIIIIIIAINCCRDMNVYTGHVTQVTAYEMMLEMNRRPLHLAAANFLEQLIRECSENEISVDVTKLNERYFFEVEVAEPVVESASIAVKQDTKRDRLKAKVITFAQVAAERAEDDNYDVVDPMPNVVDPAATEPVAAEETVAEQEAAPTSTYIAPTRLLLTSSSRLKSIVVQSLSNKQIATLAETSTTKSAVVDAAAAAAASVSIDQDNAHVYGNDDGRDTETPKGNQPLRSRDTIVELVTLNKTAVEGTNIRSGVSKQRQISGNKARASIMAFINNRADDINMNNAALSSLEARANIYPLIIEQVRPTIITIIIERERLLESKTFCIIS